MEFTTVDSMKTLQFDMMGSVMFAVVLLLIGYFIRSKVKFFERFCIPGPVIGGFLFMIINAIIYSTGLFTIAFDTTLQTPFMLVFFTTIGLGASFGLLKSGGKLLVIYWLVCGAVSIIQCIIGAFGAEAFGMDAVYGIVAGPTALIGGHGGATAYGTTIEEWGYSGGIIVGVAAATYGLIVGGLVGGPLGERLIRKYNLTPDIEENNITQDSNENEVKTELSTLVVMKHICLIMVCIVAGTLIAKWVSTLIGMSFPTYVGAMFVAVFARNFNNKVKFMPYNHDFIDKIGDVFLGLFLSMALMTLKLWELKGLAGPLAIVLVIQTVVLATLTYFVIFRILGKNYDAAVMCSGLMGHAMGATPTGIVNMSAVCEKNGLSRKAFIIVPIVGAFLVDIIYQPTVIWFLNAFK